MRANTPNPLGLWPGNSTAGRLLALLAILALAIGAGYCGGLFKGQRADIVFIRTSDVMARYKIAIQAREAFQKESSTWAEESRQLETKMREVMKVSKPSDPKASEEVRQLGARLKSLHDKGNQRDQELMAPVLAELNSGIKKFARKNGYRIVLGTLQGGVILHGEDSVDVTEALIAELNR